MSKGKVGMTIGRISVFLVALAALSYIGVHVRGLIVPPPLAIYAPAQGLTTSKSAVEIEGQTAPGAIVEINGNLLPPPPSGRFKRLLILHRGINTIIVSARKRYSKPAVVERQVLILEGGDISRGESGGI